MPALQIALKVAQGIGSGISLMAKAVVGVSKLAFKGVKLLFKGVKKVAKGGANLYNEVKDTIFNNQRIRSEQNNSNMNYSTVFSDKPNITNNSISKEHNEPLEMFKSKALKGRVDDTVKTDNVVDTKGEHQYESSKVFKE